LVNESSAKQTRVLTVSSTDPEPTVIDAAAAIVQCGGLVAFPTETVYGLGADATNADAVAKIFAAKQRPTSDPLIVHIADAAQLDSVAIHVPPLARKLADAFWPGPLTLVLKRGNLIPASVSAGLDTVAVRLPAHEVAVALIRAAAKPIAAPSANLFARPSPTQAKHVLHDLAGRIDLILDGGPTAVGLESTVLDLTVDPPAVLRPGGVTLEALRELVPDIDYAARHVAVGEAVSSPGMLLKHYSPRAELRLFVGDRDTVLSRMADDVRDVVAEGRQVGVLAASADTGCFLDATVIDVGVDGEEIGRNLFDGLRLLDDLEMDVMLVRAPERKGIGETIWDRLYRAAEGHVIEVV
jgi:L-threonylcarbamoyladenylate synthase